MKVNLNLVHKLFLLGIVCLLGLLATTNSVSAHTDASADELIDEIKTEQSIDDLDDVDCDQISDEHFEELGDAVMSLMHPDEEEHELMDNMMGGEGSESLEARHIWMGKQYLGCFSETSTNFRGSMMMGGMMNGYDEYDRGYMMFDDNSYSDIALWFIGFLVLAVLLTLVVIAIRLITKSNMPSAIDSLKIRYAKGDIDKKQFEQMKKELL